MATKNASRVKSKGGRRRTTAKPAKKQARAARPIKRGGSRIRKAAKKSAVRSRKQNAAKSAARKAAKRRNAPKRRNSHMAAANRMFEEFHGKSPTGVMNIRQAVVYQDKLAKLGRLVLLIVRLPGKRRVEMTFKGVTLACDPSGSQLEFVGGDQKLDLSALGLEHQAEKSKIVVGIVEQIEYHTEKKMDGFKPIIYFHKLGEEGGEMPTLLYDSRSQLLSLWGGDYKVRAAGIEN